MLVYIYLYMATTFRSRPRNEVFFRRGGVCKCFTDSGAEKGRFSMAKWIPKSNPKTIQMEPKSEPKNAKEASKTQGRRVSNRYRKRIPKDANPPSPVLKPKSIRIKQNTIQKSFKKQTCKNMKKGVERIDCSICLRKLAKSTA